MRKCAAVALLITSVVVPVVGLDVTNVAAAVVPAGFTDSPVATVGPSTGLALGWSGDINIARQRAIEGKTGQNIQALITKTGGLLFFDVMVIPADAARPGNAHKFINYMLRPEVSASLTNKVFYANPTLASKQFVKPEVASNPTIFLPPADLKNMVAPDSLSNDLRRLMTRTYTGFKTGL